MKPGDHLLSIAEVSLRGMNSEQVAQVLRNQGTGIVRLIVARSIDPPAAVINAAVNAAGSASIVAPTGPHSAIVPTRILSDMEETQRHLALAAASSPLSSTDADTSTHTADSEVSYFCFVLFHLFYLLSSPSHDPSSINYQLSCSRDDTVYIVAVASDPGGCRCSSLSFSLRLLVSRHLTPTICLLLIIFESDYQTAQVKSFCKLMIRFARRINFPFANFS